MKLHQLLPLEQQSQDTLDGKDTEYSLSLCVPSGFRSVHPSSLKPTLQCSLQSLGISCHQTLQQLLLHHTRLFSRLSSSRKSSLKALALSIKKEDRLHAAIGMHV